METLISIVGSDEYISKLTSPNFKKKLLWEEIAAKVEESGIILGSDRCRVAYQKWLNLKKNYVTALNKKSGRMPPWFDSLHEVILKSSGKLLGGLSLPGEEPKTREPLIKKVKRDLMNPERNTNNDDMGETVNQYIIDDSTQVTYGDVIAIMQQLEDERKEREDNREQREKERFDKLANLLKQQNELLEKLIMAITKQPEQQSDGDNHVISIDPQICIIKASDLEH